MSSLLHILICHPVLFSDHKNAFLIVTKLGTASHVTIRINPVTRLYKPQITQFKRIRTPLSELFPEPIITFHQNLLNSWGKHPDSTKQKVVSTGKSDTAGVMIGKERVPPEWQTKDSIWMLQLTIIQSLGRITSIYCTCT